MYKRLGNVLSAALGLSVAAAVLPMAGCSKGGSGDAQAAGPQMPPIVVTVTPAAQKDVPVYIDEIGHTTPYETVAVQPQVAGRITKVAFTDGTDVKKGDLLFEIDPRPFEADLAKAKATLAQQQAAMDLGNLEYNRVKGLQNSQAIAQQDIDQKKNAVDVAAAQVNASKADIETAQLNLEYTKIYSPIDGRVGQHMVDVGNIVIANNNTTPLVMIQRLEPIYADFTATQEDLPAIRSNMARGTLKVEVTTPDAPDKPHTGELTFLDNAVQDATGTVKLRATLPNHDRFFWGGQFVKVRLILDTQRNAILIPARAVQLSQQGQFVYVEKNGAADMRLVTMGQRQGDDVVITKGLNPGDQVITTGIGILMSPGAKVMVVPAGAPAGPEGAMAAGPQSAAKADSQGAATQGSDKQGAGK